MSAAFVVVLLSFLPSSQPPARPACHVKINWQTNWNPPFFQSTYGVVCLPADPYLTAFCRMFLFCFLKSSALLIMAQARRWTTDPKWQLTQLQRYDVSRHVITHRKITNILVLVRRRISWEELRPCDLINVFKPGPWREFLSDWQRLEAKVWNYLLSTTNTIVMPFNFSCWYIPHKYCI